MTADIDAADITREADRDVASRCISQEKLIEMSPHVVSADVTVQLHLFDMKENMTADIDETDITREADRCRLTLCRLMSLFSCISLI
ncbi:hypothetical protein J6590_085367 [Homalodisca vitripennis]|nr:hypothetical protein J6590_085367 [Homalodisca vitripennis]